MNKYNKYYAFCVLFFMTALNSFGNNNMNGISINNLPTLEIEANTGFVWLMQLKANLNIYNRMYIKYHHSETYVASDDAIIIGGQNIISTKSKVQFGIGYSKGKVEPLLALSPDDTTQHWNALILDSDFMHYFYKNKISIGFNIGLNLMIVIGRYIPEIEGRIMPSLNAGIVFGLF